MVTTGSKNPLIVLRLPGRSPAVRYRPHLQPAGTVNLIEWAAIRFSKLFPVVIAHHAGPDSEYFRSRPATNLYRCCEQSTPSELDAIAAAAESAQAPAIICCGVEAAFIPSSVFREAVAQHLGANLHWTTVTGLPKGVAINLYDPDLLRQLRDLRLPDKPADPIALIRCLSADNLRRAATGAGPIFPPVRSTTHHASLDVQPRVLSIQTATDVAIARNAIDFAGSNPERLLEAWTDAAALPGPRPQWSAAPRDSRTRVLFFSNHSGYSGAEEALVQTVRAMPPRQFDKFAFIPLPGLFSDRMSAAGCQVIQWAEDLSVPSALHVEVLTGLLAHVKPDVIHLNAYCGMPILAAARIAKIPLVQHLRLAALDPLEEAMQCSAAVIAVSEYVRRQTRGLRVAPEKITVLYDGVDIKRLDPAHTHSHTARTHFGIAPDRIIVLLVARLEPRKRADLFIEAIETVARSVPQILGVLVGEDTADPEWTAAIDQSVLDKSLSHHVRRLGFQSSMVSLYAAADMLVSCSDHESLGCSVLEAMSMALPVVVSDSGGTMELVDQAKTGFIFPAGDAGALAAALHHLASQPGVCRAMGRQGRAHAAARFSIERCSSSLAEVFLAVLRHAPASYRSPRPGQTTSSL